MARYRKKQKNLGGIFKNILRMNKAFDKISAIAFVRQTRPITE